MFPPRLLKVCGRNIAGCGFKVAGSQFIIGHWSLVIRKSKIGILHPSLFTITTPHFSPASLPLSLLPQHTLFLPKGVVPDVIYGSDICHKINLLQIGPVVWPVIGPIQADIGVV